MEIRINHLTKTFPGNPKKNIPDTTAVNDFNIVVPDGTLLGLLGPSGCGKSTTLYMISGLKQPTEGEIWFGDEDVTHLAPEKRGIGLVFQNYALYPHMTVYDNVKFPLTNLNVKRTKKAQKTIDALTILDLLEHNLDEIVKMEQESVYNNKISKSAFARKMVFRFHIVTSLANTIFSYGLSRVEGDEREAKLSEAKAKLNAAIAAEKEALEKKGFSINDKYEVNSACIAETGLIMGIGRFAGMDIIEMEGVTGGTDTNLENIRDTILDQVNNSEHDFFLINIDGADEAGHDGNAQEKLEFIEKVDRVVMSELLKLEDCYIFLTADHSTPISVKNHSGDPVPILINGPEVRVDDVCEYNEFAVAKGGMCRIRGADVMNIITDLMGYAHKFGA